MKYTCAVCKGEFESNWTEEEANAEKERDFGAVPLDQCDVVCDECYKQISPRNNPDYYQRYLSTTEKPITASASLPKDFPLDDVEAIRSHVDAELCRRLGEAMDEWEAEELLGLSRN